MVLRVRLFRTRLLSANDDGKPGSDQGENRRADADWKQPIGFLVTRFGVGALDRLGSS